MCVRVCVALSVCSVIFVHMCEGVCESVVLYTCAVLKTLIGKVVQLCICNSVHILLYVWTKVCIWISIWLCVWLQISVFVNVHECVYYSPGMCRYLCWSIHELSVKKWVTVCACLCIHALVSTCTMCPSRVMCTSLCMCARYCVVLWVWKCVSVCKWVCKHIYMTSSCIILFVCKFQRVWRW